MPIFVKVDEYHEVLNLMRSIRRKIDESKNTLLKIHDLKNEEDELVDQWQAGLTEVEKKLDFIEHSLNEPENFQKSKKWLKEKKVVKEEKQPLDQGVGLLQELLKEKILAAKPRAFAKIFEYTDWAGCSSCCSSTNG